MAKLKKRCKTPGCPNLHYNKSGYCDQCHALYVLSHPREDKDRPDATARGYDYRWKQFAKSYLKRHPVCAICGQPATVCDHKTMTADMMLETFGKFILEDDYYQPLCTACNTMKGRNEDRAMREQWEADKLRLKQMEAQEQAAAVPSDPRGGSEKNPLPMNTAPVETITHTENS